MRPLVGLWLCLQNCTAVSVLAKLALGIKRTVNGSLCRSRNCYATLFGFGFVSNCAVFVYFFIFVAFFLVTL